MSEALVSVIIPAYNAEAYIENCVNGIIGESFKDFELIIIDDGSKDKTAEILDRLAAADSRIRVVHKPNGGVSEARNTGIELSKGKYISFVDADDRVTENHLQVLVDTMRDTGADIVAASYIMEKSLGRTHDFIYADKCFDEEQIETGLLEIFREMDNAPWGKLFRGDIIREHNVRFPKNVPYAEDSYFGVEYFKYIKKAVLSSEVVYYYNWTNPASAMRKYFPDLCVYLANVLSKKREFYELKNRLDIFEEKKNADIEHRFSICLEHCISHVHDNKALLESIERAADVLGYGENMKGFSYYPFVSAKDWNGVKKQWIKTHRYMYCNFMVRHILGLM